MAMRPSILQRHRVVGLLTTAFLLLLLTACSFLKSQTPGQSHLPKWQASAAGSVQHDSHGYAALQLPLEYDIQPDESSYCAERFGRKYLDNFRNSSTGYCTSDSPSNLTCFRAQTWTDSRSDTLCFGRSAHFNSTDQKFSLGCQPRSLTKNETAAGTPALGHFTSYWYDTGPGAIFNKFVKMDTNFQVSNLTQNFTILVKREGAYNPWHCLMEIWSLTMTLDVLRTATDPATDAPFFTLRDIESTQIVILDKHDDGPYFDLWTIFAKKPIVRLSDLPEGTNFENIIVPLAGASNPIWQGDWDIHACGQSELLQTFTHRVFDFYHIDTSLPHSGEIVLTFIDRKDSRQLIDQDIYLEELRARTPHVKVQAIDLAAMTFAEQLKIIRETDVLVGVHGAGLTHGMFLPKDSVMVEILPEDLNHKGFRNLAGLLGHSYLSVHGSKPNTSEEKHDEWHVSDVSLEKERFLEAADVAVKILYNKGLRNYDVN